MRTYEDVRSEIFPSGKSQTVASFVPNVVRFEDLLKRRGVELLNDWVEGVHAVTGGKLQRRIVRGEPISRPVRGAVLSLYNDPDVKLLVVQPKERYSDSPSTLFVRGPELRMVLGLFLQNEYPEFKASSHISEAIGLLRILPDWVILADGKPERHAAIIRAQSAGIEVPAVSN